MIAEFESRILALIDDMVEHASDDELFAGGYLRGHLTLAVAELEAGEDHSSAALHARVSASLEKAIQAGELSPPDQALVMEGTLPPCGFANVALWNMHMQTLEYRNHRTSLNRAQMRFQPDGSFRVVVAHRDPGEPNWIDTEGHPIGIVFWRILLPEAEPEAIRCSVIELPVSS